MKKTHILKGTRFHISKQYSDLKQSGKDLTLPISFKNGSVYFLFFVETKI